MQNSYLVILHSFLYLLFTLMTFSYAKMAKSPYLKILIKNKIRLHAQYTNFNKHLRKFNLVV